MKALQSLRIVGADAQEKAPVFLGRPGRVAAGALHPVQVCGNSVFDHIRIGLMTIPAGARAGLPGDQALHAVAVAALQPVLRMDIGAHFQGMLTLETRAALVPGMILAGRTAEIIPADIIILVAGQAVFLPGRCDPVAVAAVTVQAVGHMATAAVVREELRIEFAEALLGEPLFGAAQGHRLIEYPVVSLMTAGTPRCAVVRRRRPRRGGHIRAMTVGTGQLRMYSLQGHRHVCGTRRLRAEQEQDAADNHPVHRNRVPSDKSDPWDRCGRPGRDSRREPFPLPACSADANPPG